MQAQSHKSVLSILKIYSSLNVFMFSNSVLLQVQPAHFAKQAHTELKEGLQSKFRYLALILIFSGKRRGTGTVPPLVSNIWIVLFQLGNLSTAALWHI
jgi:hypothetical protein